MGSAKNLLETMPLDRYRDQAKDLLVHPAKECAVQLHQLLSGNVGQYRAPLAFDHQIPHRRDSCLATALIRHLGIVRDEVKFAASVVKTALLDLMAAHEVLAGYSLREGGWLRARVVATRRG